MNTILLEHGKTKVLKRFSGAGASGRYSKLLARLHGDNVTSEDHPTHKGIKLWYDKDHELVGVVDSSNGEKVATVYGYPEQHRHAGASTAVMDSALYAIEQLGLTPLASSGKSEWEYSVIAKGRVAKVVDILDTKNIPYKVSTQKIYFGGESSKETPVKSLSATRKTYEAALAKAGFKLTLTESTDTLCFRSVKGDTITLTAGGEWSYGKKTGTSHAMLESLLTGKTVRRNLMQESIDAISEAPDGPLEIGDIVKAYPKYHMKAFQKLWGGHRLTWQGMPLFNKDVQHLGEGYQQIIDAATEEITGSHVNVSIISEFGEDGADIEFGDRDLQECYLGYDAGTNSMYVGFDAWAREDQLEDLVKQYMSSAGWHDDDVKSDDDDEESFAKAWSKFNENSPGFIGILVHITGRPGNLDAEVVDACSGGFYAAIYRKSFFKRMALKDLRLD